MRLRGTAVLLMLSIGITLQLGRADAADFDYLLGNWNFRLTWGELVDDTGTVEAKRVESRIEMTCDGCDASTFLRGTITGSNSIAWEYWGEAGVQNDCANDKGWQPVTLVISSDHGQISFSYVPHVPGNCSQLLRLAPLKYRLTRD